MCIHSNQLNPVDYLNVACFKRCPIVGITYKDIDVDVDHAFVLILYVMDINKYPTLWILTKWLPAAILDDRKSLSIAFLAISDQYTQFGSKWKWINCHISLGAFVLRKWNIKSANDMVWASLFTPSIVF